jgi:hypothetical protein
MSKLPTILILALILAAPVKTIADEEAHGEDEHHSPFEGKALITLMHNMQYYGHKLGLAIDAGNSELRDLYVHEVEEVIEALSNIEEYDGIEIPPLVEKTLKPAFDSLEGAIEAGDADTIDAAYDGLLQGCNACHQGAKKPFIVVQRNRDNPYPQRFAP